MGVFGHMRIHESGIDRSSDTPSSPTMPGPSFTPSPCAHTAISSITPNAHCTPTRLSLTHTPSHSASTTTISVVGTGTTDYSCPHCPRTFTSRIGLVVHLRIHHTETEEEKQQAISGVVAAAAADENASLEKRWCQLRDTVQPTALAVLGNARRQQQDRFDDSDAAISNLLAETKCLHKAYITRPTDENKAAIYRGLRLVQQRLRKMQGAWTARAAEEIQGHADVNEWKTFFSATNAVYGPPTKAAAPLLSVEGSTLLTEKMQILRQGPSISQASSTVPPPSPTPPLPVCGKWKPMPTSNSRPLSMKLSESCSSSPAGK
ncbi:hypothetical protein SprV_0200631800 [Sparganum proliferum]